LRFSARSEYGIRVLVQLAQAYGGGPVPLSQIAEKEHLPLAYLERIMTDLRREDLVVSRLGARGGYALKRAPALIGMAEVIDVLEGPLGVGCPAERANSGECSIEEPCSAHALWSRVRASLSQTLEATSLAELVKPPSRDGASDPPTTAPVAG
jgi:Rrf2 family protein